MKQANVIWFSSLGMNDVAQVGGKNASLGEMISNLSDTGVSVPDGFATTADAFREFLRHDGLDARIKHALDTLDLDDLGALAETGKRIRAWVMEMPFPQNLERDIRDAYQTLKNQSGNDISVAVRSSATAEDLPDASFAGQQETFLNVNGIENVLRAIKEVFASLYNDRAISYRVHKGFEHSKVALSAGIQRMVRSDVGTSGVMFTIDTESGFDKVILITAAYGLGESIVQGAVNPDEFYVYKPNLETGLPAIVRRNLGTKAVRMVYVDGNESDKSVEFEDVETALRQQYSVNDTDIEALALQALIIEKHYQRPMDIEWGKDGNDGKLYILQARPETVRSQGGASMLQRYKLNGRGEVLVEGRAIGQRISAGPVRLVKDISEIGRIQVGDVLVTDMTDPDWEPVMKKASAIVTNRGGRTCHAAIIARELGIPAVVGCTDATERLNEETEVTVSCAEGDTGFIYNGSIDFEVNEIKFDTMPDIPVKLMMNVGNPDRAFDFAGIPNNGVGLARLEFIVNRMIGVHPRALIEYNDQPRDVQQIIHEHFSAYSNPVEFYIQRIVEGVATIAAAFAPKPVIVRLSDFKSNEYANLVGGEKYEPHEENPMIGFRGASRYISESFRPCFDLECEAMKRVRNDMGFTNVQIMVPFVRTLEEAQQVVEILAENGLQRGVDDLKLIMMCELPSNAILAEQFLEYFDGFSIGSNDLTQLTLGVDRDSGVIAHLFDERDPAVKAMLHMAIQACRRANKYIGICGQGPSDHPDLAEWLLQESLESLSLNPDSIIDTWMYLAQSNNQESKNHL